MWRWDHCTHGTRVCTRHLTRMHNGRHKTWVRNDLQMTNADATVIIIKVWMFGSGTGPDCGGGKLVPSHLVAPWSRVLHTKDDMLKEKCVVVGKN